MRQGNSGRRPRGRPNRKQHGGPHRANHFDSNGPDGRIRGNAHQVYERYVALARDALSSGDRVSAETHYQHAEHYFRILNDSTDPRSNGHGQQGRQGADGRAAPERPTAGDQASPEQVNGADGDEPRPVAGDSAAEAVARADAGPKSPEADDAESVEQQADVAASKNEATNA